MLEFVTLYLAGLVGAAAHEAGHVIACLARKRSIRAVNVGSGVGIHLGKLNIGLIPWGGGVVFEARNESVRGRLALYGSGPLASMLFAGALAVGAILELWSVAALLLVGLQLVVSLLPMPGSDFTNMSGRELA